MKYDIATLSINEDTPNDPSLWEVIINTCRCIFAQCFETYETQKTRTFASENSRVLLFRPSSYLCSMDIFHILYDSFDKIAASLNELSMCISTKPTIFIPQGCHVMVKKHLDLRTASSENYVCYFAKEQHFKHSQQHSPSYSLNCTT